MKSQRKIISATVMMMNLALASACGETSANHRNLRLTTPEGNAEASALPIPPVVNSEEEKTSETAKPEQETRPSLGQDPSLVVNCKYANLMVENLLTLESSEDCPVISFDSIEVKKGGSLKVLSGSVLESNNQVNTFQIVVEEGGTIEFEGTEAKQVRLKSDSSHINIALKGKGSFNHSLLHNVSIWASGVEAQSFNHLEIDNRLSPVTADALHLFNNHISTFKNVSIKVKGQSLALATTLAPLSMITKENLTIDSESRPVELWGNAVSRLEKHRVRDIGYPINVKTDLHVKGKSLQIDPGVMFKICKGCNFYFNSELTQVGERDGKKVIFTTIQEQDTWGGIVIKRETKLANFSHVQFENASGLESDLCGKSLVQVNGQSKLSFHELVAIDSASFLETDLTNLDPLASLLAQATSRKCINLF